MLATFNWNSLVLKVFHKSEQSESLNMSSVALKFISYNSNQNPV